MEDCLMDVSSDIQPAGPQVIDENDNEESIESDSEVFAGQRIFDEVAGEDISFGQEERQSQDRPSPVLPEVELVDGKKVDGLIKQLGHDDFGKREKASEDLAGMGLPVLPDLARVANDPAADPEVRLRAQRIIDNAVASDSVNIKDRLHPFPNGAFIDPMRVPEVHGHFEKVLKNMDDLKNNPEDNKRRVEYLESICRMNENGLLPLSDHQLERTRREIEDRKTLEEGSIKIRLSYVDHLSAFGATDAAKENLIGLIKDKPELVGSEHLLHLIGLNQLYEDSGFMDQFIKNGGDINKIPKYEFRDPDKGAAGRGEDTIRR
jgi:hypothetical protein